jgi:ABC-type Zn uptake system ZnuABC Zn-binding protein ZnuA
VSRSWFRAVALCALLGFGFGASACDTTLPSEGEGLRVVATTTQIGALTRAVSGGQVHLTVLLKAGADSHDFEVDPQTVRAVGHSQLVLKNGIGLDDWLDRVISNAGGRHQVVVVTEGIPLLRTASGEDDPHVWQDPLNAKVMVDNIVAALSTADPAHAALFQANGAGYKETLDSTDAQVRALIDEIPASERKMVTNHDAFAYFIQRYGLTFVGAVFPVSSGEGEASARDVAALEDLVKSQRVKAVFAEAEVDPKVARELAKDVNVKVVAGLYADSLGPPGSEAASVDGMILSNARKISEALR